VHAASLRAGAIRHLWWRPKRGSLDWCSRHRRGAPPPAEAWPPKNAAHPEETDHMRNETSKSDLLSFTGLMVTLVVTNIWFAVQVLTYAS
jgi:hypothetical protein